MKRVRSREDLEVYNNELVNFVKTVMNLSSKIYSDISNNSDIRKEPLDIRSLEKTVVGFAREIAHQIKTSKSTSTTLSQHFFNKLDIHIPNTQITIT